LDQEFDKDGWCTCIHCQEMKETSSWQHGEVFYVEHKSLNGCKLYDINSTLDDEHSGGINTHTNKGDKHD